MGEPGGGPVKKGGGAKGGFDSRASKWIVWILLLAVIFALLYAGRNKLSGASEREEIDFGAFLSELEDGKIKTCTVQDRLVYKGEYIEGHKQPGSYICQGVSIDDNPGLQTKIASKVQEKFVVEPPAFWRQIILQVFFWILLFFVIWYLFFRRLGAGGGPGGMLSFGKSRARMADKGKGRKSFDDVAGIEEAKEEVEEIIQFLKDPRRFQRLGGRIPKGVLVVGPPGCGKTLLAKAIAGEADVPFFSISGSDFVEMFVGVGASRVRDLFAQARENSPCIIFLDEIDAVGRRRGTGLGGGHDEREQTLNAILVEMDGFESDEQVIMMAATNRPDVLDPALLRPGRFDRHITIDLPDMKGREAILRVHARKIKLHAEVDLAKISRATPSFSGADLESMINEAALMGVMRDLDSVGMAELEEARDKVLWGKEKRSKVMSDMDRTVIAHHESGHAIAAHLLPEADPLHKVTILPRGVALGATMHLPERDEYTKSRAKLMAQVMVLYAGRAAEETFLGDISTGASNDLERATGLIRRIVCSFGMSEKMGLLTYGSTQDHVFLGQELTRMREYSDHTGHEIDDEVRRISNECYSRILDLMVKEGDKVKALAEALLEREVLTAEEVEKLLGTGRATEEAKGEGDPSAEVEIDVGPDGDEPDDDGDVEDEEK